MISIRQNQARGVGNFYSEVSELDDRSGRAGAAFRLCSTKSSRPSRFRIRPGCTRSCCAASYCRSFLAATWSSGRQSCCRPATTSIPQRRYPVIYEIPGFGGTHRPPPDNIAMLRRRPAKGKTDFIRVLLSGNCKWGHHVYADSATNGPRGAALVREMIPHIDATIAPLPTRMARFVTGHSSGGWSSLWLQVNYPETFGGCWSTSPDPVDFRDFQQVDLYADPPLELVCTIRTGQPRPIARRGDGAVSVVRDVRAHGRRAGAGRPVAIVRGRVQPARCRRPAAKTVGPPDGPIDPAVAKAWEKYDIRLIL